MDHRIDDPDEATWVWDLASRTWSLVDAGVSRRQLRGEQWCRPFRGVRRPSHVALEQPTQRIVDAIGLLTPGCAIGGWASRYVQGGEFCDGLDGSGRARAVLLHHGRDRQIRRRSGVQPSDMRLGRNEVAEVFGVPVTTLARATYDDMREAFDFRDAAATAEMAISTVLRQSRTTVANLRAVYDAHRKTRGRTKVAAALPYLCTRAASPWETKTRLLAVIDAGITGWLVNVPVFDRYGTLLGVADLLEPDSGLVVESDGDEHRAKVRHAADNVREERFERRNLTVVRVVALDHRDLTATAGRIRNAYLDGLARDRSRDGWTTDKPDWWFRWEPGRRWD